MAATARSRGRIELVASVASRLTNVSGSALQTSSMNVFAAQYWVGPSYALGIGQNLRLGASLYGVYSRRTASTSATDSFTLLGGASTSWVTSQNTRIEDALSVAPVAGAQVRVVSSPNQRSAG